MTAQRSSPARPAGFGAESVISDLSFIMTLKHLKLIATVTPVLTLIAIEIARHFVVGAIRARNDLTVHFDLTQEITPVTRRQS